MSDEAAVAGVIRKALRMTPKSDRDDVLQVARLALWEAQKRDNGRASDADARAAFLRMRVRGDLIDECRRRRGRFFQPVFVEFEARHEPSDTPDLDGDIDRRRAVEALRSGSKPRDWQALSLAYMHGTDQRLVAAEQGICEARLSHRLKKARARAAKRLEKLCKE